MTALESPTGCRRCGSARVSYRVERYGARNQPLRSRVLVCTCPECGHTWTDAVTAAVPDPGAESA